MRGIALKIFLSFWLMHAVLFALFAFTRDLGGDVRFRDHVRQNGRVASALLERGGVQSCTAFSATVEQQTHIQFTLFDTHLVAVCRSSPALDLTVFEPHLEAGAGDVSTSTAAGRLALIAVQSPAGVTFTAAGVSLPGFDADAVRPPFPFRNVGLTILVSGLVCFAVARYLARPLQRVRDASYRLAAGDLRARVGPAVGVRRDEIGDVVRDFDAMAGRLEALVHSQSQLLWDISHELRSPLARLNVALELARRKAGSDAQVDLERIEAEAERMNELIGRVLALARAENDRSAGMAAPIDLAGIVRQVAEDADYEAQRQNKSVSLRVDTNPVIVGSTELVASAVDNVVRNAVRHTPEHSVVDIVVDGTDREAWIRVRDHGSGVPSAEIERIFSPFHRVESARNRETGGIGLGLAIARRAVAIHRGTIAAENAPDGGLVVTIRIPIDSMPAASTADGR